MIHIPQKNQHAAFQGYCIYRVQGPDGTQGMRKILLVQFFLKDRENADLASFNPITLNFLPYA
jgi:hypothetical protein